MCVCARECVSKYVCVFALSPVRALCALRCVCALSWMDRRAAQVAGWRFVVHDHASGWGPLCAFLGAPVPETPYVGNHR